MGFVLGDRAVVGLQRDRDENNVKYYFFHELRMVKISGFGVSCGRRCRFFGSGVGVCVGEGEARCVGK